MPLRHNNKGTSSCHALTGVWGKLYANTSSNQGYKDQVFLKTISLRFTKRTCARAARWQYYALLAITFFDLCRSATGAGTGKQPLKKIKWTYHGVCDTLLDGWVECKSKAGKTYYFKRGQPPQYKHPMWQSGRYLGGGVYGSVFDIGEGQCVKFLRLRLKQDEVKLYLREAEIMMRLSHDNLMKWDDVLIPIRTDPNTKLLTDMKRFREMGAGLVMEKMSGSLRDLMKLRRFDKHALQSASLVHEDGVLKKETIITLTYQLLRGAAYLQSEKIMHRDYKPDNIMLKWNEGKLELKIGDFGWSRYYDKDDDTEEELSQGPISPDYRPAEVYENLEYGLNCDVWSVGLIILEMLANGGTRKSFMLDNVGNDPKKWEEEIKNFIDTDLKNLDREARKAFFHKWIQKQNPRTKGYDIYEKLLDIVTDMLEVRPEQRPDMDVFEKEFNEKFENYLISLGLEPRVGQKSEGNKFYKMDERLDKLIEKCKRFDKVSLTRGEDQRSCLKIEDRDQLFKSEEEIAFFKKNKKHLMRDESEYKRQGHLRNLIWDNTALYIGLLYLKDFKEARRMKKVRASNPGSAARRTGTADRLSEGEHTGSSGESGSGRLVHEPSAPAKGAPADTANSNDVPSTDATDAAPARKNDDVRRTRASNVPVEKGQPVEGNNCCWCPWWPWSSDA